MQEIEGFYDKLGQFETYVGDLLIFENKIIIPVYSSQVAKHPINITNKGIVHLDYCYYVFTGIAQSKRDVYRQIDDGFIEFKQTNFINTKIPTEELTDFLLEMVDFNGLYQYWNWKILAKSFSLIVDDNYILRKEPFTMQEMDISFFERNHLEHLKAILNAGI